jgi:hypothetical protein
LSPAEESSSTTLRLFREIRNRTPRLKNFLLSFLPIKQFTHPKTNKIDTIDPFFDLFYQFFNHIAQFFDDNHQNFDDNHQSFDMLNQNFDAIC